MSTKTWLEGLAVGSVSDFDVARSRALAVQMLRAVRRDPDGFRPRVSWSKDEPHRSAWRTFRLAALSCARQCGRTLAGGNIETARLWALAFIALDARMEAALLASVAVSSVKEG